MTSHNTVIEIERTIRSNIQPRNVLIQRAAIGDRRGGSQSMSMVSTRSMGLGSSLGGGTTSVVTDKRNQEKRDMQDLNERFAGYIEKVRFLEAQNRKLGDELENLKTKWGKQTTVIKTMYQTDLDQVKNLLDESEKETAKLQIQVAALEEKIDDVKRKLDDANHAAADARDKLEKQLQQISEMEAEVNLLRMRSDLLDGDKKVNRATISRLQDALNRAKSDLDKEIAEKDVAESQRIALEEELSFLKEIHEQELRELASQGYNDPTAANREMWSSEMSTALKQMQQLYDEKIEDLKNDLNLNYSMQIQSIQTPRSAPVGAGKDETIRIRTQVNEIRSKVMELENRNKSLQQEIDDLRRDKEDRENELTGDCDKLTNDIIAMRAEMEAINKELEGLIDSKLGLELEIAAYRKLLEGESNEEGLKQVVDNMFQSMVSSSSAGGIYGGGGGFSGEFGGSGGGSGGGFGFSSGGGGGGGMSSSSGMKSSSSMSSGRTSYQRSAKGPVSIAECQADGKLIIVENTGKKSEDLGGFSIRRNVDGKEMTAYTFPAGTSIEKGSKLKLWVKGEKPAGASAEELDTGLSTWGSGKNITTQLINSVGQDRATHIQKTN